MNQTVRMPETQTDYFVPAGGLNEVSAPLRLKPGVAREMENFFCAVDGGYTRTKGVERWCNGAPAEKEAFGKISLTGVSDLGTSFMGSLVRGSTSGASCRLLYLTTSTTILDDPYFDSLGVGLAIASISFPLGITNQFFIFRQQGVFVPGETVTVYALDESMVGATALVAVAASDLDTSTPTTYATERALCDRFWRFMQGYKPPYSIGASSYTSYTQPNLALQEIDGELWLLRPAIWLPDGGIRMIFNLASNEADLGWPERDFSGFWQAFPIWHPDCFPTMPEYADTVAFNFGDGVKKLYGVTGVGQAFCFNPVSRTLEPIPTGMVDDKPTRIAVHKNRLFIAFGSSIQWSSAADPFSWSVVLGAGEINTGDEVTMMESVIGSDSSSSLVIATKSKLFILYGDSVANFTLVNVSPTIGVHPATFQQFGVPLFMSDFGVTTLAAAQSFGNFNAATITSQVQKFINSHRDLALCSVLVRSLNQYRLFFSDRTALYITLSGAGKPLGMTIMRFPFTIRRAISFVSSRTGEETTLALTEESDRVFVMDTGRNFDGDPIDWYAILAYNHSKSPRLLKTYKKAVIEIIADTGYIQMDVGADVDYGGPYRKSSPDQTVQDPNINSSSSWDMLTWDQFTYDGSPLVPVEVKIDGTGENVSIRMRNRSVTVDSFTWTGCLMHFFIRRPKR